MDPLRKQSLRFYMICIYAWAVCMSFDCYMGHNITNFTHVLLHSTPGKDRERMTIVVLYYSCNFDCRTNRCQSNCKHFSRHLELINVKPIALYFLYIASNLIVLIQSCCTNRGRSDIFGHVCLCAQ